MLSDQSPILVTGGAGFIGSHFVLDWFSTVGTPLVNLDKLTYAGNLRNLEPIADREVRAVRIVPQLRLQLGPVTLPARRAIEVRIE